MDKEQSKNEGPDSPSPENAGNTRQDATGRSRRIAGAAVSVAAIAWAVLSLALSVLVTRLQPRTDDAEIFANFIGIAPQVEGPITLLNVRDNQYVRQGALLFRIDNRPYSYALQRALSDQQVLEGQIEDQQRHIASQKSAVIASGSATELNRATVDRSAREVDASHADVANAEALVERAESEWSYSSHNLHRIEPLLQKRFVTVDAVDRAHSAEQENARALDQARAQLRLSQARLKASQAALGEAQARLEQSYAQHRQSQHDVTLIDPYTAQRSGRAAQVERAQYDLENTQVYAPFDARVTNLTISQGEYAHVGSQVFTLIDTREWWAIGNFRETQLRHVHPGMRAEVYLMAQTGAPLQGTVESIGYGVSPDPTIIGTLSPGLPNVARTLNWVRLAARYPVRVHIDHPPQSLLRLGQSAVVVIRSPAGGIWP